MNTDYSNLDYVARINYLRQAVSDLPTLPLTEGEINYYLTNADFFGDERFDDEREFYIDTFVRGEMQERAEVEEEVEE